MRSMLNEVSWCIYVIDRVHCALGCLYIVDLIVFYSALRAHVRCKSRKLVLTYFGQFDKLYTSFLTGL